MTEFINKNPQYVAKDNAMDFLSNDEGRSYSLCHCKCKCIFLATHDPEPFLVWSNFEIADMDLWRSEAYTKYFEYLDASGGFYYEASTSVCLS